MNDFPMTIRPPGHSKNHKLPVSLGAHGFATKLKQSTEGEKAATQKRSAAPACGCFEGEVTKLVVALDVHRQLHFR